MQIGRSISNIVQRTYSPIPHRYREAIAVGHFRHGLLPSLKRRVMTANVDILEDFIQIAKREGVCKQLEVMGFGANIKSSNKRIEWKIRLMKCLREWKD